ncbi:hypothetical protein [Streptococcus moroccensis]|uniref:Uncharacterized protein n=1 Tax=Streptococcus moroccensis TaxID=1451356 RepID=A0ABT9YQ73_9STRE|nr:hypothetical protein [Streptococcus moroccensis]MDQ0221737.1 hypothetical protein [Streptococcus moroccensis]
MKLVIYDPWYWIYDGLVWLGADEFPRTLVFTLVKFGLGLVLLIVLPKYVGSGIFLFTKITWKVVLEIAVVVNMLRFTLDIRKPSLVIG